MSETWTYIKEETSLPYRDFTFPHYRKIIVNLKSSDITHNISQYEKAVARGLKLPSYHINPTIILQKADDFLHWFQRLLR